MAAQPMRLLDSSERVALDLAIRIAGDTPTIQRDEAEWLKLFARCLKVMYGKDPDTVLQQK